MDRTTFEQRPTTAEAAHRYFAVAQDAWDGVGGFAAPLDSLDAEQTENGVAYKALPEGCRSYILQHPQESYNKWLWRVRNATYVNLLRVLGDTIIGMLFADGPSRDKVPPQIGAWLEDVDGTGRSINDVLREAARDLFLNGTTAWRPDRPSEQYESLEDAIAAGVRTTLYREDPQTIYDWRWARPRVIESLKLVDSVASGSIVEAQSTEQRCRVYLADGTAAEWRMTSSGTPTEGPVVQLPREVGIPVVVHTLQDPMDGSLFGTTVARQIVEESLGIYRELSLLQEHVHAQAFALLTRPVAPGTQPPPLKIGTDNCLNYDKDGPQPAYISPGTDVSAVISLGVEARVRRIYRLARMEHALGGSSPESGVARQHEFQAANRFLCFLADSLAMFERRLVAKVGAWIGVDTSAYKVSWPREYDIKDLERQLLVATDAILLPLGHIAKVRLLTGLRDTMIDLDATERKASDKEIADAVAEKDSAADAMRELAADNAPAEGDDEEDDEAEQPAAEE
jgi:hypothetical protein